MKNRGWKLHWAVQVSVNSLWDCYYNRPFYNQKPFDWLSWKISINVDSVECFYIEAFSFSWFKERDLNVHISRLYNLMIKEWHFKFKLEWNQNWTSMSHWKLYCHCPFIQLSTVLVKNGYCWAAPEVSPGLGCIYACAPDHVVVDCKINGTFISHKLTYLSWTSTKHFKQWRPVAFIITITIWQLETSNILMQRFIGT